MIAIASGDAANQGTLFDSSNPQEKMSVTQLLLRKAVSMASSFLVPIRISSVDRVLLNHNFSNICRICPSSTSEVEFKICDAIVAVR